MYALVTAVAVVTVAAEPFDKARLRDSVCMPRLQLPASARFRDGLLAYPDEDVFLPDEVAACEQSISADPNNPDKYRELAELLDRGNEKARADVARNKAAELYQARLAQHPEDGVARARYASIRNWTDEAEQIDEDFRKAVASSPKEWECLLLRSQFLVRRMAELVAPAAKGRFGPAAVTDAVRSGHLTEAKVREAQRLFDESSQSLDRAAALAPNKSEVYVRRAALGSFEVMLVWAKQALKGEPTSWEAMSGCMYQHSQDLWRAAFAAPQDSRLLGTAAYVELAKARKNPIVSSLAADKTLSLPADSRKAVVWAAGELRRLAAADDVLTKTKAAEMLALVNILFDEPLGAESFLAGVVRQRPSLEAAWDLEIASLRGRPEKAAAAVALCQERLRYKDAPRNHLLLAASYLEAKQPAEARKALEAALKKLPDSLECSLGVASLLMRSGDVHELDRAGHLLELCSLLARIEPTEQNMLNYAILHCQYFALTDRLDELRKLNADLKEWRIRDERLVEFEKLVGPEMLKDPAATAPILPVSGSFNK